MARLLTAQELRSNLAEVYKEFSVDPKGNLDSRSERAYRAYVALGENPTEEMVRDAFPKDDPARILRINCGLCGRIVERAVRMFKMNNPLWASGYVHIDVCLRCIGELNVALDSVRTENELE